ncbi:phage major tail protein, TP901-1 family, partial [Listeria monocytogenes]|uniref:phage major tail protein, TP901-1 family n=1 Tax=Listeria monocytogenes TaxID=1639 RepID=UPI001FAF152B
MTKTKDGAVSSDGGLEVTLSIEAVASADPVNKMLKDSDINGYVLEVWEIDLAGQKSDSKYPAHYA